MPSYESLPLKWHCNSVIDSRVRRSFPYNFSTLEGRHLNAVDMISTCHVVKRRPSSKFYRLKKILPPPSTNTNIFRFGASWLSRPELSLSRHLISVRSSVDGFGLQYAQRGMDGTMPTSPINWLQGEAVDLFHFLLNTVSNVTAFELVSFTFTSMVLGFMGAYVANEFKTNGREESSRGLVLSPRQLNPWDEKSSSNQDVEYGKAEPVDNWLNLSLPSPFYRSVSAKCPSLSSFTGYKCVRSSTSEQDCRPQFQRKFLLARDGGAVALDWPSHLDLEGSKELENAMLIVCGTTEGSAEDGIGKFTKLLEHHGYFPIVLNPRGCGGSPLTTPRVFSAADSDDVSLAAHFLAKSRPGATILGVGWGYGANMLAKYLGEEKSVTPLSAAVCIDNPFDLNETSKAMSGSRWLAHDQVLTKGLVQILRANEMVFRGKNGLDVTGAFAATSLREFDDAISSVVHGYETVEDFYRNTSSNMNLQSVQIPILCIQHMEDYREPHQVSLPHDVFEKNAYTMLLISRGTDPRSSHPGVASEWTHFITIEWLLAVEISLLKGRHPLLGDFNSSITLPKEWSRRSLIPGDLNSSSVLNNASNSYHGRSSGSTAADGEIYKIPKAPIYHTQAREQDSSGTIPMVSNGANGDSKNDFQSSDASEEMQEGQQKSAKEVDQAVEDAERGQVVQVAESVINVLDVTMPGTLAAGKKQQVLDAVGKGETLVTALEGAVPEDVREKMSGAVSEALNAQSLSFKGMGLANQAPNLPQVTASIQGNLSALTANNPPTSTQDMAPSSGTTSSGNVDGSNSVAKAESTKDNSEKPNLNGGMTTNKIGVADGQSHERLGSESTQNRRPVSKGTEDGVQLPSADLINASRKDSVNEKPTDMANMENKAQGRDQANVENKAQGRDQGMDNRIEKKEDKSPNGTSKRSTDADSVDSASSTGGSAPDLSSSTPSPQISQHDASITESSATGSDSKPPSPQSQSESTNTSPNSFPTSSQTPQDNVTSTQLSTAALNSPPSGPDISKTEPPSTEPSDTARSSIPQRDPPSTDGAPSPQTPPTNAPVPAPPATPPSPPPELPSNAPEPVASGSPPNPPTQFPSMGAALQALTGFDDSTQMAVTNVFGVVENVLDQLEKDNPSATGNFTDMVAKQLSEGMEKNPDSDNQSSVEVTGKSEQKRPDLEKNHNTEDEMDGNSKGNEPPLLESKHQNESGHQNFRTKHNSALKSESNDSKDLEQMQRPVEREGHIAGNEKGQNGNENQILKKEKHIPALKGKSDENSRIKEMPRPGELESEITRNGWSQSVLDNTEVNVSLNQNERGYIKVDSKQGPHTLFKNDDVGDGQSALTPSFLRNNGSMLRRRSDSKDGANDQSDLDAATERKLKIMADEIDVENENQAELVRADSMDTDHSSVVKDLVMNAVKLEVVRRLGGAGLNALGVDIEYEVTKVAEAVSGAVTMHKNNFLRAASQETGSGGKLQILNGNTVVEALGSVIGSNSPLGSLLPFGILVGVVMASLGAIFLIVSDDQDVESAQEKENVSQSEEHSAQGVARSEYATNESSLGKSNLHSRISNDVHHNLQSKENEQSGIHGEETDEDEVGKEVADEVDGSNLDGNLEDSSDSREKDAENNSPHQGHIMGALTAAMGATAAVASQQQANTAVDVATQFSGSSEADGEKVFDMVPAIAEKALSAVSPVVPKTEDGEVDHDRLVAMLTEVGQKGGLLTLVGKVALLWGGLRGAMNLVDRLIGFLRMKERPLQQRLLGFGGMTVLLWTPVLVPLLPTILQQWATKSPSGVADAAAGIGLYGALFILVTIWGRRVRGYDRPLVGYGLNVFSLAKLRLFAGGMGLGLGLVTGYYGINWVLGFAQLTWSAVVVRSTVFPGLLASTVLTSWRVLSLICQSLTMAMAVSLVEEVLFRAWLQEEIAFDLGYEWAVILSAVAFSVVHWSPQAIIGYWLLAVALSGARARTQGDLSLPVGIHAGVVSAFMIINQGGFVHYKLDSPVWFTGANSGNPLAGALGTGIAALLAIVLYSRQPSESPENNQNGNLEDK